MKRTEVILVFFIVLLTYQSHCQDELISNAIFSREENITIGAEGGYISHTKLSGLIVEKDTWGIIYTELEEVSKAEFVHLDGSKPKVTKQNKMISNDLTSSSFYTGTKAHMFAVEPGKFTLDYAKENSELGFLSGLDFGSSSKRVSSKFTIEMPLNLALALDSTSFLIQEQHVLIDTKEDNDSRKYTFDCALISDSIQSSMNLADWFIRILVVPTDDLTNPEKHFAQWYRKISAPHKSISTAAIQEITKGKIVADFQDSLDFVNYVFDQVKTNVSYIAIENNIGAIQPRSPDVICERKQGDCKDMANLICSILNHFDFKAYLGISATKSHLFKNDFPSLSSGNHLVCMLKHDNEWMQLDATDKYSPFQWPSMHTQGTTVFVVQEDSFEYVEIPEIPAEKSRISLELNFENDGQKCLAKWTFSGYEKWTIDYLKGYYGESDFNQKLKDVLRWDNETCEISELKWATKDEVIEVTAILNFPTKKSRTIGTKIYQSNDFVPLPEVLTSILTDDQVLWNAFTLNIFIAFPLENTLHPKLPTNSSIDGFWNIEYYDNQNHVELNATLTLNQSRFDSPNFNEELKQFQKMIRTTICYEK